MYKENLNYQSILRLFLSNYAISFDMRNAGTPQTAQHSTRENDVKEAHLAQTTRDVHHVHHPIVEPRATTITTTTIVTLRYLARDFQLSIALFLTLRNQEVITYIGDTFLSYARRDTRSPCSYKVEIA